MFYIHCMRSPYCVIIGSEDRNAMKDALPKIMNELKRRGMITTVSERKIEFTNP